MSKPFSVTEEVSPADETLETDIGKLLNRSPAEFAPKKSSPISEDPVNPSHYRKHPSGIECIEITRHLNFNIGNAIKYIWRHADKGDPIENLKKAQWYIDDEIRRLQGLR